jgi:hypothetical protein
MTQLQNDLGQLRATVAAMIAEYSLLGVTLTPPQMFRQLVERGLLQNTDHDFDALQLVMPSGPSGGNLIGLPRQERLDWLNNAILEAQDRFERGEPNLLEDIEAILLRALG